MLAFLHHHFPQVLDVIGIDLAMKSPSQGQDNPFLLRRLKKARMPVCTSNFSGGRSAGLVTDPHRVSKSCATMPARRVRVQMPVDNVSKMRMPMGLQKAAFETKDRLSAWPMSKKVTFIWPALLLLLLSMAPEE